MRTLMPNRYEINQKGPQLQDLCRRPGEGARPGACSHAAVPDAETLDGSALLGDPLFERATNPHSGFFAITAEQLAYWRSKPWFLNRDTNFIGPPRAPRRWACCRPSRSTRAPSAASAWLQIEHLDHKFSIHDFPKVDP